MPLVIDEIGGNNKVSEAKIKIKSFSRKNQNKKRLSSNF